jgi:hypothetical protein
MGLTSEKERSMKKDDAKLWFIITLIVTIGWMVIAIATGEKIQFWIRLPVSFACGAALYHKVLTCQQYDCFLNYEGSCQINAYDDCGSRMTADGTEPEVN